MNIKKELENIVISLHKIVQGQNCLYVKKYSIVKSQFGVKIQLHIFKNCSGLSILNTIQFAKQIIIQFQKDLKKNNYVNLEKTLIPDLNNIIIYGGKNQAYIGFTSLVDCDNINKAKEIFEQIGYRKFNNIRI